jgi:hypothetical protein
MGRLERPCAGIARQATATARGEEWLLSSRGITVVISSVRAMQLWMGLMCTISTPTMVDVLGISLAQTCIQPPGAAHKSMTVLAFFRN